MFTKNRKKLIKSLHQKKFRDSTGLFIVEGEKMVGELLDSSFGSAVQYLLASKSHLAAKFQAELISEKDMESISTFKSAPGILAVVEIPEASEIPYQNFKSCVLLDDIKDPGNLGTILRSAEWFGVDAVLLSSDCVEVYNPKVVHSTMGSLFRVPVFREEVEAHCTALKENGHTLYAADMNGTALHDVKWKEPKTLVIGSESHGLGAYTKEAAHEVISITGKGQAESLNAAVAASIILSHW